jgi:hypothetical protein
MRQLFTKRVKDFRDLLDESRHIITPLSHWGDVKSQLQKLDDERFDKFPERNRIHTFSQHIEFL